MSNLIIKKCELSKRANVIMQETAEQLMNSAGKTGKRMTRVIESHPENALMLANPSEAARGTTAPGLSGADSVMNVSV
jgi:hypothetical protein